MKTFQGRTVIFHNIETFENVAIGTTFFNFTKDISAPQYKVIDKKFYLLVEDDDAVNHNITNHDYVIERIEINAEDWFKSDYEKHNKDVIKEEYCGDRWDGEFLIETTIQNLHTNEIILISETEYTKKDDISNEFIEWSAYDENEAFMLADWYDKSITREF